MSSDYLTVAQVAEHLWISPKTVRRWIADGLLPAVRVGPRLLRISREDVEALVNRFYNAYLQDTSK